MLKEKSELSAAELSKLLQVPVLRQLMPDDQHGPEVLQHLIAGLERLETQVVDAQREKEKRKEEDRAAAESRKRAAEQDGRQPKRRPEDAATRLAVVRNVRSALREKKQW